MVKQWWSSIRTRQYLKFQTQFGFRPTGFTSNPGSLQNPTLHVPMTTKHLDTYYKLYNKWNVNSGIINIGCNAGVARMNIVTIRSFVISGKAGEGKSKLSLDYGGRISRRRVKFSFENEGEDYSWSSGVRIPINFQGISWQGKRRSLKMRDCLRNW